ncbi:hypothetical protein NGB36_08965 [Streptomyces sp. RB6PN25]|uniref:Uncharacterized protein n=1 Tax=Streptomyces humicola TaxID=2953240 RepID=A0ABT1PST2_9ACTN|nr:hypothetical protein [Streptomyces humicola]MCQ4080730.1 hypothetical protein [Streptomyces humicola]
MPRRLTNASAIDGIRQPLTHTSSPTDRPITPSLSSPSARPANGPHSVARRNGSVTAPSHNANPVTEKKSPELESLFPAAAPCPLAWLVHPGLPTDATPSRTNDPQRC